MELRTRAYRRDVRRRAIHHKRHIVTKLYGREEGYQSYPVDGVLSKGKIHCSCGMCQVKTRIYGWKRSDQQKIDKVNWME